MNRQKTFIILNIFILIILLFLLSFLSYLLYGYFNNDIGNVLINSRLTLPQGWKWETIFIILISSVSIIFIINLIIIIIVSKKIKNKNLFKEEINSQYQSNSYLNKNDNNDYILYHNDYYNNLNQSNRKFVKYNKKLRDDFLENNWWLY